MFEEIQAYDPQTAKDLFREPSLRGVLDSWVSECAEGLKDFEDHQALDQATRNFCEKKGVEARVLIHPFRFILTGKTVSPGLFELMSVLGKDVCLKRIRTFLAANSAAV